MVTGRILQFDHARGYGFVAADNGGEDVFLHASVFEGDPGELVPGVKIEFEVMAGDRGRKAFAARPIDDQPDNDFVSLPRPVPPPRPGPGSGPVPPSRPPAPSALAVQAGAVPAPHAPAGDQVPDDEPMCDVLSSAEFGRELTELLLSSASSLTGQQVVEVRQSVLESARKHGWVDV